MAMLYQRASLEDGRASDLELEYDAQTARRICFVYHTCRKKSSEVQDLLYPLFTYYLFLHPSPWSVAQHEAR